jgi:N-acetylmuramoyl-L-alanine amidase
LILITPLFLLNKHTLDVIKEQENIKYIYIDPGHGGKDGGAISNTGIYEKDINLLISYRLKSYLENCGYNVKMTRYGDYDLASHGSKNRKNEDINKRIDLINNQDVILYISIHCNIYTSQIIKGAQTFYKDNEENKMLANIIQNKLKCILKNTTRDSKKITGKYLIDNSQTIGCLVEVGFLSNPEELALLTDKIYQDQLAYCIYLGIIEYLGI